MVIGNLLSTRHTQVWVLAPPLPSTPADSSATGKLPMVTTVAVHQWPMREISKPTTTTTSQSKDQVNDSLEEVLIDFVIESHLAYGSSKSPESEKVFRGRFRKKERTPPQNQQVGWSFAQKCGKRMILVSVLGYGMAKLLFVVIDRATNAPRSYKK
jgi:hypothetical protein